MRILETKVYTFSELSEKAQQCAIDGWRESEAGDTFFAECTIEEFAETIAPCMGWTLSDSKGHGKAIYFSGFNSQGDGACFEGTWYPEDLNPDKIRSDMPEPELLRIVDGYVALRDTFPAHGEHVGASVRHRGHYYHAGCTSFDTEGMTDDQEKELIELSRDLMNWLYRRLESEYDWYNGDERIRGTIEANEYEFTAEGKMIW